MWGAVLLVPLAACSFDPALVVMIDGDNPLPLDAADVDGKPDAPPEPDASPGQLDAADAVPLPDSACSRFGVFCESAVALGTVSGDTGGAVLTATGNGDTWYYVRITEDSDSKKATRAHVRLDMPADVDFDVHVHCGACGSGSTARAENPIGFTVDELTIGNGDHGNGDAGTDTFDALIHIVHYRGEGCGDWTLTVTGNDPNDYYGCL